MCCVGVGAIIRNIMQVRFMLQNLKKHDPKSKIFEKSKNIFVYGFTVLKITCKFT